MAEPTQETQALLRVVAHAAGGRDECAFVPALPLDPLSRDGGGRDRVMGTLEGGRGPGAHVLGQALPPSARTTEG